MPDAVIKAGAAFDVIQFSNIALNPEPFVIFISYGSFASVNKDVFTVTVIKLVLFLTVVRGETSPPPFPTNNTVALTVSNKEPLIAIVALLED